MGQRTHTHRTGDGAPRGAGVGGMSPTGADTTSGRVRATGGMTIDGRSATGGTIRAGVIPLGGTTTVAPPTDGSLS
eukprot:9642913-Alexandrium_andersonii.AAC.1